MQNTNANKEQGTRNYELLNIEGNAKKATAKIRTPNQARRTLQGCPGACKGEKKKG